MARESLQIEERLRDLTERVAHLESARATRAIRPQPVAQPIASQTQRAQLEGTLGRYWLSRLGILSLVTGLAFLVTDGFVWLNPLLKVLLGFSVAGGLIVLGRFTMSRQIGIGRILIAGGLGVAYYTTYALHYVPTVHIVSSPALALVLLVLMVLLIILTAHRMQSESVAGVALFLGLHTGMVSPIGPFTLISGALLAAGSCFLLARNRWVYVPISTLLAVNATHLLWLLGNPLLSERPSHASGHFSLSIAFAILYFAIFHVAQFWVSGALSKSVTLLFARLNWACLVALLCFEFGFHEHAGLALSLAALSGVSVLSALIEGKRCGREWSVEVQLTLAMASAMIAAWVAFSGASLLLVWSAASMAALLLGQCLSFPSLLYIATTCLGLSYLTYFDAQSLLLAAVLAATTLAHERVRSTMEAQFVSQSGRLLYPLSMGALALYALSTHLSEHHIVLCWMAAASGLFILGGLFAEMSYRVAALGVFLLSFARLFLIDMAALGSGTRIVAFVLLGTSLLLISYWYARRSDRLEALDAKA